MTRLILFNKPYLVLCQFTDPTGRATLADYGLVPDVYPAGRLDHDSEGLLVLTDSGTLQQRISDPRHKLPKTYWVQVEGDPAPAALRRLQQGIALRDGRTRPAGVRRIDPPAVWPRSRCSVPGRHWWRSLRIARTGGVSVLGAPDEARWSNCLAPPPRVYLGLVPPNINSSTTTWPCYGIPDRTRSRRSVVGRRRAVARRCCIGRGVGTGRAWVFVRGAFVQIGGASGVVRDGSGTI